MSKSKTITAKALFPSCPDCGSKSVGLHRWDERSDPRAADESYWSYTCADCPREVSADTLEEALAKWTTP